MFKKTVVLSVVVALMVLGLFVDPSAAQTLTNVSKRGSLLIFPKINTLAGFDTIIMLGNDASKPVDLKCYWMDSTQAAWDFEITLTKNQPVYFSAKTGEGSIDIPNFFGPGKVGELKCWAITFAHDPPEDGDLEMLRQFDYLYGNALLIQTEPVVRAFEYNAFAFKLNRQPTSDQSQNLDLDGDEYDRCPAYLIYNFFGKGGVADGAEFGSTTLTLSPCQQDLRQDKLPVCAKAKFDLWNSNEQKQTLAYQCVKCWFEGVLTDIGKDVWAGCDLWKLPFGKCKVSGNRGINFLAETMQTDMGRFRVSPDTFTACRGVFAKLDQTSPEAQTPVDVCYAGPGRIFKTPFLGVLLTDVAINAALPLTDAWAGTTGAISTPFVPDAGDFHPYIRWDRSVSQWTPKP